MLADLGADVIHIEGPDSPDLGRNFGGGPAENGLNPYFHSHNRGKRAMTLDLKTEAAREVFYKLVKSADVFVSNLRLKALERLGVDYDTLKQYNPRLVYARGSGYGPNGPDADLGAMDVLGQARGGIMMGNQEEDGTPRNAGTAVADHVGAISMAFGVMAALLHRERTGEGQQLDSSLLGGQLCIQSFQIATVLFNGNKPPVRKNGRKNARAFWNSYKAGDGKWFAFGMSNDRYFPRICKVLNRLDWLEDPRYNTLKERDRNAPDLIEYLDGLFATQPRDYWIKLFSDADLLITRVNDYHELLDDPQMTANDYLVQVERDDGEPPVTLVGAPVLFGKTPAKIRHLAPELDQHTEEVMLELGYEWEEIEKLRRSGAIGAHMHAPA